MEPLRISGKIQDCRGTTMSYSRRQLEALGQPLGESVTSFKPGGRIYGSGGGGGGGPSTTTQIAELPEWARGYAQEGLAKAEAVSSQPFQTYGGPRIAGFSPLQTQAQTAAGALGPAAQLGQATGLAGLAGTEAFRAGQYAPGQFTPQQVMGSQVGVPTMEAAQTGFRPDLQMYQMAAPERVRTGTFTRPGTAEQYMSPYIEQAIAPQLREAQRTSNIQAAQLGAQAAQAGAFGGSRSSILEAERRRNLATQMGDIRAKGLQSAYEQAQQLYGTEQQRALQAQLANQQAGLTAGGQNLAAALGVQQLGTQTGLQTALANLSSQQQANVQNQAAALQTQGLNAQQALQAALANQQATQQSQQLGEQSRQFGAGLGLQGLGTALSAAGQLGQLGQQQFGQQQGAIGLQSQLGAQQQALRQQGLTQAYQDFLNEQNYPYKQLGFMSDLIRGLPLGQQSAQQVYAAAPSPLQTIGSLGLGAYGLKQLGMFAEGGSVTDDAFVESALDKMSDMQLAEAERAAVMRNDTKRLEMIAEERATRASERSGLAGAFNAIPQANQERMVQAARGGILAFNGEDGSDVNEDEVAGIGDPTAVLGGVPSFIPMTLEQRQAAIKAAQEQEAQMRGLSPLTPFIQDIAKQKEALGGRREENKGLVALAAAQALSGAPGLRQGIGQMFGAIGTTAASVNKDLRDSERLIKQSELALTQAEEARKNMQFDKASALVDRSEAAAAAADARKQQADMKRVEIASRERTAKLSREQQAEIAKERNRITLEAAKIQAERPGEMERTIRALTKTYQDAGMPPADAQLKAAEFVLGRSQITNWTLLSGDYLAADVAKDPTLKDDPVRLAQARADAGTRAAANLHGYAQRAETAAGRQDVQLSQLRINAREKALLDPAYREADVVLRNPKASQTDKQEALRRQEAVIDRIMGMTPTTPGAAPAAPQRTYPAPNDAAVSALKNGLGTREQFDAMFGPGAAAKVLGK